MIVILEGPDGSGKSTLAEAISEWSSVDVFHTGNPKTSEELIENVEKVERLVSTGSCIIDRFPPISECVYSKVFDRPLRMDLEREPVATPNSEVQWVLIYCRTSNPIPLRGKAHKDEGWDDAVKGSLQNIQDTYDEVILDVYNRFPQNVVKYDYKDENAIENVIHYLSLMEKTGGQ